MDFEYLYITWFSRMKNFAYEYVTSEAEAENITQDIFLELYEHRLNINETKSIESYLFTCVRNRCLDFLRKKVVEQQFFNSLQETYHQELQLKLNSLEALNIDLDPTSDGWNTLLHESLYRLPEQCRRIFMMNKIEKKKQKDIAKELNISINTVESQMAIAYKKLRQDLGPYLPIVLFLLSQ